MESNGKTGFKWFLIFLGIVTCVGGLIALATVIVNNGVSTEEALGDNDRYVRSDVSPSSSFQSDNDVSTESSIVSTLLDDFVSEEESSLSSSDIYGVSDSIWNSFNKSEKVNRILYYGTSESIKNGSNSTVASLDGVIEVLMCDFSPYKDSIKDAKYSVYEKVNKYGIKRNMVELEISDFKMYIVVSAGDLYEVSKSKEFTEAEKEFFNLFKLRNPVLVEDLYVMKQ